FIPFYRARGTGWSLRSEPVCRQGLRFCSLPIYETATSTISKEQRTQVWRVVTVRARGVPDSHGLGDTELPRVAVWNISRNPEGMVRRCCQRPLQTWMSSTSLQGGIHEVPTAQR